jgi:NADH-quinone oxidoreductase subunit H
MTLFQTVVLGFIQAIATLIFIFILVPLTVFAERKVLGYLQQRLGATRVAGGAIGLTGFMNRRMWALGKVPVLSYYRGIPMLLADILKLFLKEDILPTKADKFVFLFAPALSLIASMMVFTAISYYPGVWFVIPAWVPVVGSLPFKGVTGDMNIGLLFILGVASVGVYGIVLAGWASNSKYPLLGGLRSAAQIVSYEVPLTLSLIVPVILTGSLNFNTLTIDLATKMPLYTVLPMFVAFFLYLTAGFAECNRLPFDMAEAENELVAGFHTEYSGIRFGLFYLAEYINMVVVSALASAFFLGGPFLLPFGFQRYIQHIPVLGAPYVLIYVLKILLLLFGYIWVRGTIPRYRYDQIQHVAWKFLLPLTLVNLMVAVVMRFIM